MSETPTHAAGVPTPARPQQTERTAQTERPAHSENMPQQLPRHDQQRTDQQRTDQQRTGAQRVDPQPSSKLADEWQAVQYEFVDDPKAAVRKADGLVTRALEELTTRHRSLAKQLEGNGDPQTEDLRLALHRYRELFKSLVAVK